MNVVRGPQGRLGVPTLHLGRARRVRSPARSRSPSGSATRPSCRASATTAAGGAPRPPPLPPPPVRAPTAAAIDWADESISLAYRGHIMPGWRHLCRACASKALSRERVLDSFNLFSTAEFVVWPMFICAQGTKRGGGGLHQGRAASSAVPASVWVEGIEMKQACDKVAGVAGKAGCRFVVSRAVMCRLPG